MDLGTAFLAVQVLLTFAFGEPFNARVIAALRLVLIAATVTGRLCRLLNSGIAGRAIAATTPVLVSFLLFFVSYAARLSNLSVVCAAGCSCCYVGRASAAPSSGSDTVRIVVCVRDVSTSLSMLMSVSVGVPDRELVVLTRVAAMAFSCTYKSSVLHLFKAHSMQLENAQS